MAGNDDFAAKAAEAAAAAESAVGVIERLNAAMGADTAAAALAAAAGSSLAQAKRALAAESSAAAAAVKAESAAQAAAAREVVAAAKSAATEQAAAARTSALAQAQAAREAQQAAKAAAREQASAARTAAQAVREAAREQEAAAQQVASAQRAAAQQVKQAAQVQQAAMRAAAQAAREQAAAVDEAQRPMHDFGQSLTDSAGAAARVPGPIGAIQDALSKLGPEGQAAAVGLGVATAAITAMTAAILGGMAAAISIVQTRAALLATFSALGGGAVQGKATFEMVERLGQSLPYTTDQVSKWAASMQQAGVQGRQLESAVKAIAAAEALTAASGGGGADAAERMMKALAEGGSGATKQLKLIQTGGAKANKTLADMGLQTKDVAAAMGMTEAKFKTAKVGADAMAKAIEKALQAKGKGPLDAMATTLPVMLGKLKDGFLSLFDGLGPQVQKLMAAIKSLFGEFNKGGAITNATKPLVQSVFSTLITWATKAVTMIHGAFQQIVIAILKARIALDPVIKKFRELSQNKDLLMGLKIVFALIGAAISVVVFIVTSLAKAFLAVAAFVIGAAVAIMMGIGKMGNMVQAGINKVKAAIKGFSFPSLAAAAGNMITSFIAGITGKIGSVVAAMLGMGKAAGNALKSALGIASPSKVAVAAAGNVTGSFSDKIDSGKKDTQASFDNLVKPPPPPPGKGGGKKDGGGGGRVFNFNNCNFGGATLETIREMMTAVLDEEGRASE